MSAAGVKTLGLRASMYNASKGLRANAEMWLGGLYDTSRGGVPGDQVVGHS